MYYHKADYEVDFLVKRKGSVDLYQVAYDVSDPGTKDREVRAMLEAMKACGVGQGIILNSDTEKTEKHGSRKIFYIPLWKWAYEFARENGRSSKHAT